MKRVVLVLSLSLGAALAAAQEPPPTGGETTEDRRRALAARVARLRGRALVQAPGAGGWTPLAEDGLLQAGDRVRAENGPVELAVPGSEDAVRDLGTSGGDRVVLAPDARVVVNPPGSDARLRVEEGGVFATGSEGLRVQAGDTTVTVRGGDTELEVSRTGDVTVTVHSGRVDVDPSPRAGEARALADNERLTLDARGARVTKTRPRPPAYVTALLEAIGKVVRAIQFQVWPGEFREPIGERHSEGHVTSTSKLADPEYPDDQRVEVRLGRLSEEGGVWLHEPGIRLRVRYRLHAPALVELDLKYRTSDGEDRGFRSVPFQGRVGAWDEVEFRCEELACSHPDDRARRVVAGDRATYLSIYAGRSDAPNPGLRLDVSRILVFTTKPR